MGYSLAEISARFGGEILGDAATRIEGVGTLQNANADEITFLANSKYRELLAETRAAAVIVGEDARESTLLPRIVAANPYAYFAKLAQLLRPKQDLVPGVHPSALVEASAVVAASAHIGPFAYVGAEAKIGENAAIGPHCSIGARVQIGADSLIYSNVAIYADCILGARAVVHSGAVIGADGFGIAFEGEHWIKIPQTGRVVIGDDVEIGANTTIDRGAIDDTVLEDGVKLDNQIQIGHNVRVGAHTAIAGCVGVAGSAQIGRYCRIGGAAGVVGHISICDNVTVSAFTLVTKSIARPGSYSGALPQLPHRDWLAQMAQLRRLHELAQHVRQLEQRLAELERGKT
jgi:UDP-3-O-[3-hydroxymyristoyl] glucosamine N-acyltransferase